MRIPTMNSLHALRRHHLLIQRRSLVDTRLPPPHQHDQKPHYDQPFYSILFSRACLAASFVYVVTEYIADITLCEGPSMSPTILPQGEIVLIDKWNIRRFGMLANGEERAKVAREKQKDAPVWHEPFVSVTDKPRSSYREMWRQMRSPLVVGDVVVVQHPGRQGTVCKRVLGLPGDQVLGRRLTVVPDGHVWLEGDNPANSADSRHYGPVPAALIVGRVLVRLWPLRGQAFMERGYPPKQNSALSSMVLPAGYEGQEIIKTYEEKK